MLATSIDLIVAARREATLSARRQQASDLARAKAHELWGDAHVVSTQAIVDVGPAFPGLAWSWEVKQSGVENRSSPALKSNDSLHEIVVRVRYPTAQGTSTVEFHTLKARR
ncbi:MAG: hypothetical protein Q8O67_08190 [Deltaproteobacteria bacterium]|nr:hypothetical protein [Deltaproteobacteria bacterium]